MTTKFASNITNTKYDILIYSDNTQNINKDTKLLTYNTCNIHSYQVQSTYKSMNGVFVLLTNLLNKCM